MVIFLNNKFDYEQLTLDQKTKLFVGKNFWETDEINSVNIVTSDGPHGLRKEVKPGETIKSICYPTSCLSACSFDVELMKELGSQLGEECIHNKVDVLLGPGINIKRNPLCGRNFEYYSEDPLLSGKLASSFINGVQSKNVGACLKHFALNSQEDARFINDSICDERAKREIYLKGFEICIKESNPWLIMASYNKIDGIHACENEELLTQIGRKEFNFKGCYVSDWGGVNNPINSLKSGLNLEMPGNNKSSSLRIKKALDNKELDIEILNKSTQKMLELYEKVSQEKKDQFDLDKGLNLAKKIADESMVLLKNEDNILPLNKNKKICLIGEFVKIPHYQGTGSSKVNPIFVDNLYDAFKSENIDFDYAKGYSVDQIKIDKNLENEALSLASKSDYVVMVLGFPSSLEGEGFDKKNLDLPVCQVNLLKRISHVNKNIIAVLQVGSPVHLDYLDQIKGLIYAYLSGSKGGESLKDILIGKVNPSGRLAETFLKNYSYCPSEKYYLSNKRYSLYKESIYVGYRYYDTFNVPVTFPFGYGLSYSEVIYSNYSINLIYNVFHIKCTLTNKSDLPVKEVVQIYVGQLESRIFKAKKELKAFTKVSLEPNESKDIELLISKDDLRYYSSRQHRWCLESGIYRFYLAKHSLDQSMFVDLKVKSDDEVDSYDKELDIYYHLDREVSNHEFEKLLGHKLNLNHHYRPFTIDSPIGDFYHCLLGFIVFKLAKFFMLLSYDKSERKMMKEMIDYQPIRSLRVTSKFTIENLEGLVDIFNYHPLRGLKKLLSRKEKK